MRYRTPHLILFIALVLIAELPSTSFSQHPSPQPPATNPLIDEMGTLDGAFRDIVSAVALGDTNAVHKALESMHGTMEKTQIGLQAGTVPLRKNPKLVTEFKNMDRDFHEKLESLNRATQHNNKKEMQRITKQLLEGCVQCHEKFRP